ncbi:hypothetical protein HU200_010813 [Digitaria exilis]|uniref:Uncharacterized protein n=1 Tax=Digitaria exilis TaxID=1010633 RepID=A0A835KLX7_9POAL|nr:hypothetical protein HU200_010813 [Digitaria exilis]
MSPLSRQSLTFYDSPTYHAGAFYEIDHEKLPPKSPIHLKSIRVVTECTNLDVTVKFPSLQALRSFFSSYPTSGTVPEFDERFVMSSNHAARILRRQVAEEEVDDEVHQDSFWLVKPGLYDFAASRQAPPPPPPARSTGGLRGAGSRLLPAHHLEVRWRRVGHEASCQQKSSKKEKKRTVESKDGDPRHGKDRWSASATRSREKPARHHALPGARSGAPVMRQVLAGGSPQMEQLMSKDGDFDAERAYCSLKEKYHSVVRANEKLEKQVFSLKDMCENVVQMNGILEKEVLSFKEKYEHVADKNDKLEDRINSLSSSFLSFKCQLDGAGSISASTEDRNSSSAGLAPSPSDENQEDAPRTAVYLASSDQMTSRADSTVIQGVPNRPARKKSSFRVCKPQGTFLWPSMASGTTISEGASSSCPATATPGPGIPRSTSNASSAGPGLPRSSLAPAVEVAAAASSGLDEHLMVGALFSTPPSAASSYATAAATMLQLSLPSPRSPLQPQKLFGTAAAAAAAAAGFSPQKLLHFSGLARLHVVSSLASSLLLFVVHSSSDSSVCTLQHGPLIFVHAVRLLYLKSSTNQGSYNLILVQLIMACAGHLALVARGLRAPTCWRGRGPFSTTPA